MSERSGGGTGRRGDGRSRSGGRRAPSPALLVPGAGLVPIARIVRIVRFVQIVLAIPAIPAVLAVLAGPAEAARTRVFSTDTYEAFRRCELQGVALTEDGRAILGPERVLLDDPGVRTIWALAPDGRGGVLLATGDGGQVLARGPGGGQTVTPADTTEPAERRDQRDDASRSQVLATLFDAEVFALAADGRGSFYAAGAPVGTITRISPQGEARTLFDVPEGVVFALLARADGTVFAATGDRGRLYRISPGGDGKVLYEAPDLSLRSLAWGNDGKIWAGTDGRGLVLEIDPESGDARIRYDAEEDEIVALVPLPDGGLVFGANPALGGGSGSGGTGGDAGGAPGGAGAGGGSGGRGPVLYRMDPDGAVRRFWTSPEKMLHAVVAGARGEILAATSDRASVYRIAPDGHETLLWRADESQVLALAADGERIWAGTGGPGRLYRLGPEPAREGEILGRTIDAGDQARWGALRWVGEMADGGVRFETRTGYTQSPDGSWSDWAPPRAAGPDRFVASPPGRYLQWRARFTRSGAERTWLRRVDVAGATANAAPRILSLRLSPDEPAFGPPDPSRGGAVTQLLSNGIEISYALPPAPVASVMAEDVPQWVRRLRSVIWEAQDPDGDELRFTVSIRAEGETEFRPVLRDHRDRAWTLDQSLLPDGLYELRVTASDAPANPAASALEDTQVSPPFRVDTTPPVLREVRARRTDTGEIEVSGTATDESSPLRRIEASVDGEEYGWLAPEDGLLDAREERFAGTVTPKRDQPGSFVVVRAQDGAGNRGLHRAWLEAGGATPGETDR